MLGKHAQIAFIFAIFVIDQDDHLALGKDFCGGIYRSEHLFSLSFSQTLQNMRSALR